MSDKMTVTILDNGSIKIETDQISPAVHGSAEMLLRELIKGMGGEVKQSRRAGHTHTHVHNHEHEGHSH